LQSSHSKRKKKIKIIREGFKICSNHDDIEMIHVYEYIGKYSGYKPHIIALNTTQWILQLYKMLIYQYNKKTKPASSSNMADEIQNAISPL
jgi:hypothetical protein